MVVQNLRLNIYQLAKSPLFNIVRHQNVPPRMTLLSIVIDRWLLALVAAIVRIRWVLSAATLEFGLPRRRTAPFLLVVDQYLRHWRCVDRRLGPWIGRRIGHRIRYRIEWRRLIVAAQVRAIDGKIVVVIVAEVAEFRWAVGIAVQPAGWMLLWVAFLAFHGHFVGCIFGLWVDRRWRKQ